MDVLRLAYLLIGVAIGALAVTIPLIVLVLWNLFKKAE